MQLERGGGGDGEGGGGEGGSEGEAEGGNGEGGGGGEGGGDVLVNPLPPRGPQSVQSEPKEQPLYAAPGPPSSHTPSLFQAGLGHALIPPPGQAEGGGGEDVPKNNLLSSANARPFP